MPTENTSLKNTTPAGDSNTTNEMVIGKINTYQRTFLIVAGSLLALLVLIAVASTSGGHQLQSSVHEIAKGVGAFADYQVDNANLALSKDIFGYAASENNGGCNNDDKEKHCCYKPNQGTYSGNCEITYARGVKCSNGGKQQHFEHCCPNGGVDPCQGCTCPGFCSDECCYNKLEGCL